jgi:hypothetical protein
MDLNVGSSCPRERRPSPPRWRILLLLLVLGGSIAPSRASARTGAILPLGGLGIPATEIGRVQHWMESALGALPGHRWISGTRVTKLLRPPRIVSECESQCLAGLARALGAEVVVSGEVGSLSGAYMLYLRLTDASGRSLRTESALLDPNQPGLREAARALAFRLLLPHRYRGTLSVQVDVPNAWIYLDGRRIAHSPTGPIPDIGVGTHALRVTHEAYRDFVQFVSIGFDATVKIDVRLSAFPVKDEELKLIRPASTDGVLADNELPWYRRWWAVTTLGAIILGGTAPTVAILARRSVARDSDLFVRP